MTVYTRRTQLCTNKNYKLEVWKMTKFDDLLLQYCNAIYNQNIIEMDKKLDFLFPQEKWPWNSQQLPRHNPYFYGGIMLCNSTTTNQKVRKFLGRIKMNPRHRFL